jgi:ATP-dependent Clp protease protease subunit
MNKWFTIRNEAADGYAAEIELLDGIGFWGMTANDFIKQVKPVKGRVLVRINSGGGSVFDAVAIYNYLRSRKGGVDTIIDGFAASAATIVMLAGDKRSMGSGTFVMVHRASADTWGNADEIRKAAEDLEKIEGGILDIYRERTGATDEQISEWMDGDNHWLDAAEAAAAGFSTETFQQLKAAAHFSAVSRFNDAPAALLAACNQPPEPREPDMKVLMKALCLSDESNEAAAVEAVNKLKADMQAAQDLADEQAEQVKSLTAQIEAIRAEAEAEATARAEAEATALVNTAIESGKVNDSGKDALLKLAKADIAAARALIAATESPRSPAPIVPAASPAQPTQSWRETRAAQIAKQLGGN